MIIMKNNNDYNGNKILNIIKIIEITIMKKNNDTYEDYNNDKLIINYVEKMCSRNIAME